MKKFTWSFGTFPLVVFLAMFLTGCTPTQTSILDPAPLAGHDFSNYEEPSTDREQIEIPVIDSFVQEYNAAQSEAPQKISNGYIIQRGPVEDSYSIKSEGADLLIQLNEKGEVITAYLVSNDMERQLQGASVIMNILLQKEYVPPEQRDCLQRLQEEIDQLQDSIREKSQKLEQQITEDHNFDFSDLN